jgi:3-oxoacyl-[acyl-carrier protein] reductase
VAVVIGGSGAIGSEISARLAAAGVRVAVGWHRRETAASELVDCIRSHGGEALAVQLDQADHLQSARALSQVETELGVVQIVVAAAVEWPTLETSWDRLVSDLVTNLAGPIACIEQVLPGMRRAGWGRVVTISTDLVDQPMPATVAYTAAKGGLEAATRVWALREARHGVLCNVVRPGFTLTDKVLDTPALGQSAIDAEAARTPTSRICTPTDVATAVEFLATDANTHINGQTLSIGGGRELSR